MAFMAKFVGVECRASAPRQQADARAFLATDQSADESARASAPRYC